MEQSKTNANHIITKLASSVDELIKNFTTLKAAHQSLQQAYNDIVNEKEHLQQQHQAVKQKINSMINRLQTLE